MRILGTTMVLLGSLIAASGHSQENATNKKDEITYRVDLDDYNHSLGPITALDVTSLAFREELKLRDFKFVGIQIKFFEATNKLRDKYPGELIYASSSENHTKFTIKNSVPFSSSPVSDEQVESLLSFLDIDKKFLKVEKDNDGNPVIVINTKLEDRLPPELLKLTQGNFQANMVQKIKELSQMTEMFGEDNLFKDALKAIEEKKAKLLFYDPYLSNIDIATHKTMISAGAITYATDPIEIHFNLYNLVTYVEELKKENPSDEVSIENKLAGTIANELVHLMSDLGGIKSIVVKDIGKEIEAMKSSEEPTENEKQFERRMKDEILSQLVDDIVSEKLKDPKLKIDDSWLKGKFIDIYFTTITYFEVNYNVKLNDLTKEQMDEVFQSIIRMINNDNFQKSLKDGLKRFKLFDES